MKRSSTLFLQVVIIALGIVVLTALLWEPHLEGRNAHATLFAIYFKDPFLAYIYLGSIPFFGALYQASKLLGYIEHNKAFSPASVEALRNIKYCGLAIVGFIAGAEAYLFIMVRGHDDIAGGVAMGFVIAFASLVIAVFAALLEQLLHNAIAIKSENDLTV
jgi:hypothetical protein